MKTIFWSCLFFVPMSLAHDGQKQKGRATQDAGRFHRCCLYSRLQGTYIVAVAWRINRWQKECKSIITISLLPSTTGSLPAKIHPRPLAKLLFLQIGMILSPSFKFRGMSLLIRLFFHVLIIVSLSRSVYFLCPSLSCMWKKWVICSDWEGGRGHDHQFSLKLKATSLPGRCL